MILSSHFWIKDAVESDYSVPLFNRDTYTGCDESYFNDPDPEIFDIELVKEAALKPNIELQPHQKEVQKRFAGSERGKMLLMHALGSGKSLTGLGVAEQLGEPYTAVVPASLRNNMRKEITKFTDGKTPSDVMSYTAIGQGKPVPNNSTLIFDEGQRLRNPDSLQAQRAMDLADQAKRVAILSGTPIVNDPSDLAVPMSMVTGQRITPEQFRERYVGEREIAPSFLQRLRGIHSGHEEYIDHEDELRSLMKGHVDYYAPDSPTVPINYKDVPVEMGREQSQLYKAMYDQLPWALRWKLRWNFPLSHDELARMTSFMSGPRQVGLSTAPFMRSKDPYKAYSQSPKLQKAMELLKEKLKDKRTKALVFSNFIGAGLEPYGAALAKAKVPYGMFSGSMSDSQRKKLVDDYNTDKIRVALLGPSGAEGISTRGTQLIQLLDPYWNGARGRQSVGRGVRFDSHWDLPEDLKNVEVQRFIAKLPLSFRQRVMHKLFGRDYPNQQRAADDYLTTISDRKDRSNQQFIDLLKDVGSHKEDKAAAAKGIPDRKDFGDLSNLEPGKLYDMVRQQHNARRAGIHEDFRVGDKYTGLHSFALRKGLPEPGKKTLAVHQPLHSHEYGSFEGEIPEGYGAGTVKMKDKGRALVTDNKPESLSFTTAHDRYPSRYTLVKPKSFEDKNWLALNNTPTKPIPHEKKHYKLIPDDKVDETLENIEPGTSVQPKLDGAAILTKLLHKHFDLSSYRTSKVTGGPITHTERVYGGRPEIEIPKDLRGTLLRGELYGTQGDKAVHPSILSGLLNSSISKSLKDQKDKGIDLKNSVFDIEQFGRKKVTDETPYEERMKMIKDVLSRTNLPKHELPEEAKTPEAARKLWETISKGKHPLTEEGIVIHPPTGTPSKAKLRKEHDVHIRKIFEGLGKYKGTGAGGFAYSHEPSSDIVGKVGTGLSDEVRKDMLSNPEAYLNRIARVSANEKLPSGALRGPSYISLHDDYPTKQADIVDPYNDVKPVYSYVPTPALHKILSEGLYSGKALLKRKDLVELAAKGRNEKPEEFTGGVRKVLKGFKPESAKGPNVLFSQIPETTKLIDKHPSKTMQLSRISINLAQLLRDYPKTRIHGQELVPYNDEDDKRLGDAYIDQRHRNLTLSELSDIQNRTPEDLWSGYSDPEARGMYAPNVPHAAIITPRGIIPSQYLKQADTLKKHKTIAIDLDGTLAEYGEWKGEDHFGEPRKGAKESVKAMYDAGHTIIVHTCRGNTEKIKEWLDKNEIPFHHINKNPKQPEGTSSKLLADVYVDDRAVSADKAWSLIYKDIKKRFIEKEALAASPTGSPLQQLLQAKQESDRRNYGEKQRLLRSLIQSNPTHFAIDSLENGIAGITHLKTGFRIHLPQNAIPVKLNSLKPNTTTL